MAAVRLLAGCRDAFGQIHQAHFLPMLVLGVGVGFVLLQEDNGNQRNDNQLGENG